MATRSTILVPMSAEEPEDALDVARDLATPLRADLCLLHVVPPILPVHPEIGLGYDPGELVGDARALLARRAAACGGARWLVREGDPGTRVLATIAGLRPRLVVMGTHGRRGLGRLVLGSVAERVARESATPVMTVRLGAAGAARTPRRNIILVPMDLDARSADALGHARHLARALGAEICLLHVNASITPDPELGAVQADWLRTAALDAERFLTRHARAIGGARTLLREGDPASQILAAIEELRPRFTVMGTRGRHGIERVVLGSVTERVTREASAPVLSVSDRAAAAMKPKAA
jgi:nucleotide-binding universal stress UspA family protein